MKKIFALLLAFSMTFLLVGCNENKKPYKVAMKLMEEEQYSQAADAFAALGEYEDSAEKNKFCKYQYAEELFNKGDFDQALKIYTALGEYEDSSEKILLCKYKNAENLLQIGKIDLARTAFTELGDYSDAQQKVEQIKKEYYFENFGYIIPKFNVVRSDVVCIEESHEREDNRVGYDSYDFRVNDSVITSSEVDEFKKQCADWAALIDNVEGISLEWHEIFHTIKLNGSEIGSLMISGGGSVIILLDHS